MNAPKRHAGNLTLVGGMLCMDFVNTVDWRGRENPIEFLNDYKDLVDWGRHAGIVKSKEAKALIQKASKHPIKAKAVLNEAVSFREALYRIVASILEKKAPGKKDLITLNEAISKNVSQMKIVHTGSGFKWESDSPKDNLDGLLFTVTRSASDLLLSESLARVKRCTDSDCGWLFLDTSKNRSRRWCDMTDCGNRAKANRFYKRNQNTINPSTPRRKPR